MVNGGGLPLAPWHFTIATLIIENRTREMSRVAGFRLSILASWLVAAPVVTVADPPNATVTGGPDTSGRKYSWTVTNEHTSPVVYVEFPHYHGSLFFAPENWRVECTFLVNVGVEDRPGIC